MDALTGENTYQLGPYEGEKYGSHHPTLTHTHTHIHTYTHSFPFRSSSFVCLRCRPIHPFIRYAFLTDDDARSFFWGGCRFNAARVKALLDDTLEEWFAEKEYDASSASGWTVDVTRAIEERIRDLEFPRYKVVVQVVVGQNKGQGVNAVSRCLWSVETDTWTSSSYKNASLFAVAMAFGVYFE